MLKAAYIGEYGLELDQQSCLNMLLYIHADRRSSWRPFGVFGDERYHVIGGNQQIAEGLMQGLSQEIQFDKKLTAAIRKANGQVELVFDDGETSKWDAVVLAIPFSTLREVDLSRLNLPEDKTNAINRSTHGTNSKLMVGFNGPIWKNAGFNGSTLVDGLDSIQVTWESNPTGARDSHAVLTNYTGGQLGAGLNSNDLNHEVSKFLLDLESIYAGSEKNALQTPDGNYVADLTNWVEEPLSKGSYTCNQPGYFTSIHLIEGRPEENVYFTGEHCDTFYEWQGFMEGAARSAIQTATQIARDYVGNLGKDGK